MRSNKERRAVIKLLEKRYAEALSRATGGDTEAVPPAHWEFVAGIFRGLIEAIEAGDHIRRVKRWSEVRTYWRFSDDGQGRSHLYQKDQRSLCGLATRGPKLNGPRCDRPIAVMRCGICDGIEMKIFGAEESLESTIKPATAQALLAATEKVQGYLTPRGDNDTEDD